MSVQKTYRFLSRRHVLAGLASSGGLALAGCASTPSENTNLSTPVSPYLSMYGPVPNERFPIPAVELEKVLLSA